MNKHYRTLAALVVLSSLLLSSFSFFTPAAMDQNEGPAAQGRHHRPGADHRQL